MRRAEAGVWKAAAPVLYRSGYDTKDSRMTVSTTPTLEGKRIVDYRGLVSGEAAMGANIVRDLAFEAMAREAEARGANAIAGVDLDHEIPGRRGSMLMASANGTAVVVEGGRPLAVMVGRTPEH